MSKTPLASSECTFDEDTECILDSSFIPVIDAEKLVCYGTRNNATTAERLVTPIITEAATDIMTMGNAVRIPCALRSAARRTMLDILCQLQDPPLKAEGNELATHISLDNIETENREIKNETILKENVTSLSSLCLSNKNTSHADVSRSLRHLLPSRRKSCDEGFKQQQHFDGECLEEDSISDADDERNDSNIEEIIYTSPANNNSFSQSHLMAFAGEEKKEKSGKDMHQRTWMRLFDRDDQFGIKEHLLYNRNATMFSKSKPGSLGQISTLRARQSDGFMRGSCTGHEDDMQRKTFSHTSLATLLEDAEALADAERLQSDRAASSVRGSGEKRLRSTDVLAADEEEDTHLLSRQFLTKSFFNAKQQATEIGTSMLTAFAALHGVGRKSGGRARTSTTLKQLSDNVTSARVIAYITRSFENWRLDAAAIPSADAEEASERDATCPCSSLLETSGVQLKLLVEKVENAFSLYFLRCNVVWAHADVSNELFCGANPTAAVVSTSTECAGKRDAVTMMKQDDTSLDSSWTVVLTAVAFHCTPIIVGEHVYLAKPFFCYPAIFTIVSSLNITSDASLQRMRHSNIRQRRPRDENLQSTREGHPAESQDCCGEGMSVTVSTPGHVPRASALLTAVSPFKAYDPFVNPPTNLLCGGAANARFTTTEPSIVASQGPQRRRASVAGARGRVSAPAPYDAMGGHFPRGPGDEWDVPLEVLLALCPPRRRAHAPPPVGAEAEVGMEGGGLGTKNETSCLLERSQSSSISSIPSGGDE